MCFLTHPGIGSPPQTAVAQLSALPLVVPSSVAEVRPALRVTSQVRPDAKEHVGPDVLKVTALTNRLRRPDQPLVFKVEFAPLTTFSEDVELVVLKSSGGRWRFDLHLQAVAPEVDGVIMIEAAKDQTSFVPLYLYAKDGGARATFSSSFSPETPLEFNISRDKGDLPVRPAGSDPHLLYGHATDVPDASAPIWVSFTCRDFGKIAKGRLFVETSDGLHCTFEIQGKLKAYVPPSTSQMRSSVDNRLPKELAQRLVAPPTKKNFHSQNLKDLRRKQGAP